MPFPFYLSPIVRYLIAARALALYFLVFPGFHVRFSSTSRILRIRFALPRASLRINPLRGTFLTVTRREGDEKSTGIAKRFFLSNSLVSIEGHRYLFLFFCRYRPLLSRFIAMM